MMPAPNLAQVKSHWSAGNGDFPLVSVICHVYNQREYVDAALCSVLRQETNFPFEVIVRDDASTDGTAEIVAKYAQIYPGVVRTVLEPENRYRLGVKPIATTFPLARGEFIAYCEGDDHWLGRDKLQRQVAYMRTHPQCGLVHGNYLNLIKISGAWRTRVAFRNQENLEQRAGRIYETMLGSNRIQTCTVLCRRELVAKYRQSGPGVDTYMVGDWPSFLYTSRMAEIGFIEEPLAAYRRTPGSLVNSGSQNAVARGLDAIRMTGEFCDYFADSDEVRMAALASQYRVLLKLAFMAGDRQCFDLAQDWLRKHKPALLASIYPHGMHLLMRQPRLRSAWVNLLPYVERVKHRIEFRLPMKAD